MNLIEYAPHRVLERFARSTVPLATVGLFQLVLVAYYVASDGFGGFAVVVGLVTGVLGIAVAYYNKRVNN